MLGTDVVIMHVLCQLLGLGHDTPQLHAHGEPVLPLDARDFFQLLLQPLLQHGKVSSCLLENSLQETLRLLHQCQQHMQAANLLMIMQCRILLGTLQCIQNSLCIFFLFHILFSTFPTSCGLSF